MPIVMKCPFFKKDEEIKLSCEGGIIKFPDKTARREYLRNYCAEIHGWHNCTLATSLEQFYDRIENEEKK